MTKLRPYLDSDAELLAILLQASVEELAVDDYTADQRDAWAASAEEASKLALFKGEPVIRIRRLRSLAGARCIVETIVLPSAIFDGLQEGDIPNNLYNVYAERFGVTIAGGSEILKAVSADSQDAHDLGVPPDAPLLLIDRVATGLDGRPMEWRVSLCATAIIHYATELR